MKNKYMNHMFCSVIWIFTIILMLTTSCAQLNQSPQDESQLYEADWSEVLSQAKGQTVNFYMWGGSDTYNRYIDEWVAPRLFDQSGVTLKRIPVNDIKDTINKLLTEKQAGKKNKGSVDIMWINGENFKLSKDQQLLWGAFASRLPSVQKYVQQDALEIANDFGEPTDGLEAPWGKAQFVMIYDSAKITEPPRTMQALQAWIQDNPGKFTYPAPPDFTGSAWVRIAMYELAGGVNTFLGQTDFQAIQNKLTPLWSSLNAMEPYMWREGKTYPDSLAKLEQLYANGEVWMSMSYDPARAANLIKQGVYPSSTRTYVFTGGTLANTHYLTIPFNSAHQAGAMVAIDFLLSPEAQITKYDPTYWGEEMAIEIDKLSDEQKQRIAKIDRGEATLAPEILASHRLPEISSTLIEQIEKEWLKNVVKK